MLTGPMMPVRVHHAHERLDDVVDVGERSRLLAVAVDLEILAAQRRDAEIRNHAAVVDRHPRAVGIEDAHDADVDVVLPVVVHHQAFGDALALVVAGAHADRIDVAPVALGLRMLLRVAVNFAGRGEQDARAHALGQPQHVDRAHHAGLDGLHRVVLVVHRRGRAGEVKDAIDFEQDRLDDVVADELEIAVAEQMHDVGALAAEKIVEADDFVAVLEQPLAQMRAEKSRAAGYQYTHRCPPGSQRRFSRAIARTVSIT